MKKFTHKNKSQGIRSLAVIGIALTAIILASWGLYTTVFSVPKAAGGNWHALITVSSPVYTLQPFTITGVISTPYATDFTGRRVVVSIGSKEANYMGSKAVILNKAGIFKITDMTVPAEGLYVVRVWYDKVDDVEIPQRNGGTLFNPTKGLPVVATILVKVINASKNQYSVSGTITKIANGKNAGYVTPISVYFANKACPTSPLSINVTPSKDPKIGVFSARFTWNYKKCGGFGVRPYYKTQWLKNASGHLAEYYFPIPVTSTPTRTPPPTPTQTPQCTRAPLPSGCTYIDDSCTSSYICKPTITPTPIKTAIPPVYEF